MNSNSKPSYYSVSLVLAGSLVANVLIGCCATAKKEPGSAKVSAESNPPMKEGGPNWGEVDKSVARVKAREEKEQAKTVTTSDGFKTTTETTVYERTTTETDGTVKKVRVTTSSNVPNEK